MKPKKIIQLSKQGHKEAIRMGLSEIENWTPLLIHIHTSRLLMGLVLGVMLGFALGIIFGLIVISIQ